MTSSTLNPYKVTEGQAAILECRVTAANPSSNITWQWYKTDRPGTMIHNGPTLRIPNIQRNRSGSYSCTASNSVGTSEVVDINIDVQCELYLQFNDNILFMLRVSNKNRLLVLSFCVF